jgi:DNA-binding PadR family transcriptional regulator
MVRSCEINSHALPVTVVIPKALVAASTRPLILSILADSGESYGYDIINRVKELTDGRLEWQDGMLYPVLHRLEQEGLLLARWGRSETGRRRRYYRLKKEGHAALELEKEQWLHVHEALLTLWNAS